MSKNLKKIFLNRLQEVDDDAIKNQSMDRGLRHLRKRNWEDFDRIWVQYNNKEATFEEWSRLLDKWLESEEL
jgi:hypothetical protein|tara:strand:+ start:1960 stop:2175 length:216 start_codon:yes stop_codon:yes gene_type:complete